MNKYEQKLMWRMIRNLLHHLPARHPAVDDLFRQADELISVGRYPEAWLKARAVRDDSPEWVPRQLLPESREPLRWHDLAELELRALGHVRPSAIRKRVDLIGHLFGIDSVGVSLMELLYLKQVSSLAGDLFRLAERVATRPALALSVFTGHDVVAVERRLSPTSRLAQYGLADSPRFSRIDALPELSSVTCTLLSQPLRTAADVRRAVLGCPLRDELDWDDFEHLGEDAALLADLLTGALRKGQQGVSVLLYGPPGTGKTEFSRTLVARLNADLYALGEEDGHGGSPDSRERLGSIQMAQRLLRDDGEALLLVDEAEDVLDSPSGAAGSFGFGPMRRFVQPARVFLHRLLENAPAPMLWVCNRIQGIDSAVMRRFSYVMEVQPPSSRSRQQVWRRALEQHGYGNCESLAVRCAELPVSPGIAVQAVRSARLAGRGAAAVEQVARRLGQGVSGKPLPVREARSTSFSLDLIRADQDVAALTERLAALSERCFSICVDGPPGTGKSAWVRHLAERLDMEVRLQRASDLLNMFVGGTEANIARAFARARAAEELLVFDEADSFLADRRGAQRGWEVTAVNEMLTWMESHPLPFACTTNLLDAVDPAAMRRFTFKLRFEYLDEARVRAAFRRFFGAEWPDSVPLVDSLAPGDFAVVKKRAGIEGIEDRVRLARMLAEERRHKPGRSRGIGFLQPTK